MNDHGTLGSLMLQDEHTVFPSKRREPLNPVTQHHIPRYVHLQDDGRFTAETCSPHVIDISSTR